MEASSRIPALSAPESRNVIHRYSEHQLLPNHAGCIRNDTRKFIRPRAHPNFFLEFDNMEPTTPTTEVTWEQCQKPTPVKARIQGIIDFLKSENIISKNKAIF